MASIQKRASTFRVRITREGKSTLSATFSTRLEAQQWAKDTEAQIRLGLYREASEATPALQTTDRATFMQAATHYMNTHSIHKKIVRSETYRLQILIKRWGDLPIEQVDKAAILHMRDDLLKLGRSGDTINHYFNTISKLFQMLSDEWDLPLPNPIKGIKRMPPSAGRSKRIQGVMESLLLGSSLELGLPLLHSVIQFAIQTGMRRGEIMGLTWGDIDIPNRRAYLHTSKNGEARMVPLTIQALDVLNTLGKDDSGKVFPMSLASLRNQFERARKRAKPLWSEAGINPFEDLRFHDLRHEALSRLSDAGLNVIELSYISGHKTLSMLKRYTHPSTQVILYKLDRGNSQETQAGPAKSTDSFYNDQSLQIT